MLYLGLKDGRNMLELVLILFLSSSGFSLFMILLGIARIEKRLKEISEGLQMLTNIYLQKR